MLYFTFKKKVFSRNKFPQINICLFLIYFFYFLSCKFKFSIIPGSIFISMCNIRQYIHISTTYKNKPSMQMLTNYTKFFSNKLN